jgi:hypothetical protein
MARHVVLVLFALAVSLATSLAAFAADAPTNLAGITLGDEAAKHKGRIRAASPPAPGSAPWVRRLPVTADKFYSGGYVLVGTCAAPGRVLRIKMRYRDESLDFFRKISGDMLSRYGDPTEYKGETDGRVMGNKWAFSDPWLRPVSLILQRVEGEDPEAGPGNTIKLTNWGLLEAERACWQERHAAPAAKPAAKTGRAGKTGPDNGYLPR